jgi:hypothetical protein
VSYIAQNLLIMKRNEGKYKVVDKLPKTALLVKDYAKSQNVGESAIYNQLARGKAQFEIVIYFERNFVVPH